MKYTYYKYVLIAALAIVTASSFFLANLLISLLSVNAVKAGAIVVVILNLTINFVMFYLLFQLLHTLTDKDKQIEQLSSELNRLKTPHEEYEKIDTITFNPAEIAQSIIPSSPQSLSLNDFCDKILIGMANTCQIVSGIFYVKNPDTNTFIAIAKYAYYSSEPIEPVIEGEGIVGQTIKDKKPIAFNQVPADYLRVVSGLGNGYPRYLYILPILNKDDVIAAIELSAFVSFEEKQKQILEHLSNLVGRIILKLKK